jgi:hypothetical protein
LKICGEAGKKELYIGSSRRRRRENEEKEDTIRIKTKRKYECEKKRNKTVSRRSEGEGCSLNSAGSRYGLAAGSWKCAIETCGFLKSGEFLGQLIDC